MRPLALIFVFSAAAFPQIAFDGISASASRTVTLAPDEASISVLVSTGLGVTRQQVADALQTAGFSGAVLVAVAASQPDYGYPQQEATQVAYQFAITLPTADLKDINQKLEAFRAGKPESILAVRYQSILRSSDAAVEDARQRLIAPLLADARKRAQSLAAAAGLSLGAIVGVSDSSYSNGASTPSWFNSYSYSTGSQSSGPQITFTLSVKFALN
jgi:uncharacterized protein YggE